MVITNNIQYLRQMLNRAEQTRTCKIVKGMLQRTLKIHTLKKFALILETSQRTLKFFLKCVATVVYYEIIDFVPPKKLNLLYSDVDVNYFVEFLKGHQAEI